MLPTGLLIDYWWGIAAMVFSSLSFLFWFLPFFLSVYYLAPDKYKNLCLFGFSVAFYAFGTIEKPYYILLVLLTAFINYALAICISRISGLKGLFLTLGLILDFGVLFVFKYLDFILENLKLIPGFPQISGLNLVMPIGISFYTFQIASYLVDVYRGDIPAEKSLLKLSTYMMMFPKLTMGPITRYGRIENGLSSRTHSRKLFADGVVDFVIGLGLKVLLANRIGVLWSDVCMLGFESVSVRLAWLGIFAYSMQIYFDFYGYSLMAVGLGKMIGFRLPQNFRHPYLSRSMTEFWRRWHITLGAWFKDYIYIPLGGNRRGRFRTLFNLAVVWMFTACWHGSGWNFIIWGLFLFLIITVEKAGLLRILNKIPIIGHIYMTLLIPLSWLIFATESPKALLNYLKRLVGIGGISVYANDYKNYSAAFYILLAVGLLFCTRIPAAVFDSLRKTPAVYPILLAVFGASVFFIYKGMNDPFLYFRF